MPVLEKNVSMPSLDELIKRLRAEAQGKIGMILTHVGVVRESSRGGHKVSGVKVRADAQKLEEILAKARQMKGISAVEAYLREGTLEVGEILMILVVAGDFRENVFEALRWCLNEIKREVTSKEEQVAR